MNPLPLLASAALSACLLAAPPLRPQGKTGIVEAEWGFIRHCQREGVKASFIEAFHPEGLVFLPDPVNGKKWYASQPESKSQLAWYPVFSFTSAAEDLGYNAGPWTWRPEPDSAAKAFGWFFSVWKKDPGTTWRLFWDIGVPTRAEAGGLEALKASPPAVKPTQNSAALSEQLALDLDRKFSTKARLEGLETAYRSFLAPAGRVLRSPEQPASGWEAVRTLLAASPGDRNWEPRGALVAASGELLFVQGAYTRTQTGKPRESGSYIRVWRRLGAAWTLELDLESPQSPK